MKYKIIRWIKKLLKILSFKGYVLFKPFFLHLEITTLCNLNCSTCSPSVRNRKWNYKFMPVDFFKNIIDQLPLLKYLSLTGMGEVLLDKNIFKMIKIASEKGIKVQIATNCVIMNSNIAEKLIKSGLYSIIFSIDAADKETFEKIRRGASFEKVIKNIRTFINIKKKLKSKVLTQIYCVGTKDNINQIPDIVELGKDLGVEHIRIQALFARTDKDSSKLKKGLYSDDIVLKSKKILNKAKKLAAANKISFIYSSLKPTKKVYCTMPFFTAFITFEGFVTPCCVQGVDPRIINFGNLHNLSFKEIWNSKKYRDFRISMLSSNPPAICVNCPRLKGLL